MNYYVYPGLIDIKPTREQIKEVCCRVTGVTFTDARSKIKKKEMVIYRTLYWNFLHKYYGSDLSELSIVFIRRRSTVLYALKRCNNKFDSELQKQIKTCERMFLQYEPMLKIKVS